MYLRRLLTPSYTINCSVGHQFHHIVAPVNKSPMLTFHASPKGCSWDNGGDGPKRHNISHFNNQYIAHYKFISTNNGIDIKNRFIFRKNVCHFYAMKPQRINYSTTSRLSVVLLLVRSSTNICLQMDKDLQRKSCYFYCTSAGGDGGDTDSDFVLMAKDVIGAARKINVMAGSIPLSKVVSLLKELHSRRLLSIQMQQILSQRLQLLQEPEIVIKLTEMLLSHGLKENVVINILNNIPVNEESISFKNIHSLINNSLHDLRKMGFSETDLQSLLATEPGILFVDSKTCTSVLLKLKGLFTTVDALKVIQNSPNVLSDPWKETNAKFDYAYFTMGYKQPEIMNSHLFGHTLEQIEDRHIFLIRAGLFHPVKEKDNPRMNPNPPLSAVIDSSNHFFALNFGGLSEEEYKIYLAMREVEREDEESDYSDETDEEEEQDLNTKSKRKHKKK